MTSTDLRAAEHDHSYGSTDASAGSTVDTTAADLANGAAIVIEPEKNQVPIFPGELLRTAREKSGLSKGDVATRLRMAVRQIDALEKADYNSLPSGTFLRGFVRNYAKVVQADSVKAIQLLEQTHSIAAVSKPTAIVLPNQDIKINIGPREIASPKVRIAMVAGVMLLLAGAVWYWWEFIRPNLAEGGRPKSGTANTTDVVAAAEVTPPVTLTTEPASIMPTPLPDGAGPMAIVSDLVAIDVAANAPKESGGLPSKASVLQPMTTPISPTAQATASVAPNLKSKTAPSAAIATAPIAAPRAAGTGMLGFTFSGDSWVEVTDSTGKTILSRRYKAGDVDEVVGRVPFSVVVGKAGVTRMAYNGKEVNLAPHTKLSVARITVK